MVGGRDWLEDETLLAPDGGIITSQGKQASSRSWESQRNSISPRASRGPQPS